LGKERDLQEILRKLQVVLLQTYNA